MKKRNEKQTIAKDVSFPFSLETNILAPLKITSLKKYKQIGQKTRNKEGKSIGHEMPSRSYIVLEFKKIKSTKMY